MHKIPDGFYSDVTKPAHFKVGVALYQLANMVGEVRVSTKDLSDFCHLSESTLTRAFRDLEALGYLTTERSRKGFNRFSFNVYKMKLEAIVESKQVEKVNGLWAKGLNVVETSLDSDTSRPLNLSDGSKSQDVFLSLTDEHSTGDTVIDKPLVSNVSKKGIEILRISTPTGSPEKKSSSEKKSKAKPTKLSMDPRDCRTRARRPVEGWTTWDVAAEFAERLAKRYPLKPLLINQKTLASALLPMRSKYNSNAKVEMILLEQFFGDRSDLKRVVDQPQKIIGTFLNTFKTDLEKVLKIVEREDDEDSYLFADDGTRFENTMRGLMCVRRHNQSLAKRQGLELIEGYFVKSDV
jgi:hypothetical protein